MSAIFSPCGAYRYRLERDLSQSGPTVAVIGVNPSTADAIRDDQTVAKDQGFGRVHGWGRMIKGNLFGYRSTDIGALAVLDDPEGPDNRRHLAEIMQDADQIIAAWGRRAKLPRHLWEHWRVVAELADRAGKPLYCFGTVKDGQPKHTERIAYASPIILWERPL